MSSNADLLLSPATGQSTGAVAGLSRDALVSVLQSAPALARDMQGDEEEHPDIALVSRTLGSALAHSIMTGDKALFDVAVDAIAAVWEIGDPAAMYPNRTPDFEASLWETLVVQLYAAGAIAVRRHEWAMARAITLRSTNAPLDRSWLRQGQTASARATTVTESLFDFAPNRVVELDPMPKENAVEAACQFDLISALIISESDPEGYFTNAAQFDASPVEPLVLELRDASSDIRRFLWYENDEGLRESLAEYDRKARLMASIARWRGEDWRWVAFTDARILIFLADGSMLEHWDGARSGWSGPSRREE